MTRQTPLHDEKIPVGHGPGNFDESGFLYLGVAWWVNPRVFAPRKTEIQNLRESRFGSRRVFNFQCCSDGQDCSWFKCFTVM